MKIGKFNIETDGVFIIAELSANHNGSLDIALKTIRAAAEVGANAIKLQTYTPDTMTINCDKEDFIINGTIWDGKNLYKLYEEAHTPWEWHQQLFNCAKENGLICFSTPFDKSSVDFLEGLDTPAYKIASFEITDIPLIEYTASKKKPIIISTGIATHEDIESALDACYRMGNRDVALLKCTSSYPAPIEEANLVMVKDMAERYGVITGLSDHTIGHIAPVVATCFGARIIEKHFILDKTIGGPDASFSLTKDEFGVMVNSVRQAEKSIGTVNYDLTAKQVKGRNFSRSIYVVKDIKAGQLLTEENVRVIRPGFGIHPKLLMEIMGRKINCDVERGTALHLEMII